MDTDELSAEDGNTGSAPENAAEGVEGATNEEETSDERIAAMKAELVELQAEVDLLHGVQKQRDVELSLIRARKQRELQKRAIAATEAAIKRETE